MPELTLATLTVSQAVAMTNNKWTTHAQRSQITVNLLIDRSVQNDQISKAQVQKLFQILFDSQKNFKFLKIFELFKGMSKAERNKAEKQYEKAIKEFEKSVAQIKKQNDRQKENRQAKNEKKKNKRLSKNKESFESDFTE